MIPILLATSSITIVLLVGYIQEYMRLHTMPHLPYPATAEPYRPYISLLIPARNEARNIARLLEGALRQQYDAYEVIVVDDHSIDATPDILAHYAARDPRLRVVHGDPLPSGWMGKPYACVQAADAARGEWLIFLDADTIPLPTFVAALVSFVQKQEYDMVTVFPFMELGSFWERFILPPFITLLHAVFPFHRLNAPDVRSDEVMAIGQCICVRRDAYTAIGGHTAVRGEVLDDVMLARALHHAGFRTAAMLGLRDLRVRMYTSGREVVAGLTKNAVAGFKSAGNRVLWQSIRLFGLALLPLVLLAWGVTMLALDRGEWAWVVCVHSLVVYAGASSFWGLLLHRRYALPWNYAVLWPFGLVCYGLITVRSLWKIRNGQGIEWKGRTYVGT